MRSNNNSTDEKDYLAIGQKEYKETNPFGYKEYKETFDSIHWWKTVEYTDEKGEKIVKEINPLGQVMIHQFVNIRENTDEKKENNLDESLLEDLALLEDLDFDDQKEAKKEQRFDWNDTPAKETDPNNLTRNDFFKMDWKETQYQLYKLLLNISSSLSNTGSSEKE